MLKLSQPITSINGFKIGDKVRLKDGDGRPHIIKSFSIDGMKEFFFEVQFEDGTETMFDNIAPLPSNLDDAADAYSENILANGEDMFDAIADGFRAGAEWMAGQGVKLHGRILPGPRCNLYIESDCFDRGFGGLNYKFSDSNDVDIFVQILDAK